MSSVDFSKVIQQSKLQPHALLSPSKAKQWKNYDEESLMKMIFSSSSADIGTVLHAYAADRIKHGFKFSKGEKKDMIFELLRAGINPIAVDMLDSSLVFENLTNYVNDAIGFQMNPEVRLDFSEWCFGTADALKFYERDKLLRIHDLKTGIMPVHMDQLIAYASLFLLRNRMKAIDISIELRIYQSGDIIQHLPTAEEIIEMMNIITEKCAWLDKLSGRRN